MLPVTQKNVVTGIRVFLDRRESKMGTGLSLVKMVIGYDGRR